MFRRHWNRNCNVVSEPGAVGRHEGENSIDGESRQQPNFCHSASKGIALQVKEQSMTTTLNFARRAKGKSPAQQRLHQVQPACIIGIEINRWGAHG